MKLIAFGGLWLARAPYILGTSPPTSPLASPPASPPAYRDITDPSSSSLDRQEWGRDLGLYSSPQSWGQELRLGGMYTDSEDVRSPKRQRPDESPGSPMSIHKEETLSYNSEHPQEASSSPSSYRYPAQRGGAGPSTRLNLNLSPISSQHSADSSSQASPKLEAQPVQIPGPSQPFSASLGQKDAPLSFLDLNVSPKSEDDKVTSSPASPKRLLALSPNPRSAAASSSSWSDVTADRLGVARGQSVDKPLSPLSQDVAVDFHPPSPDTTISNKASTSRGTLVDSQGQSLLQQPVLRLGNVPTVREFMITDATVLIKNLIAKIELSGPGLTELRDIAGVTSFPLTLAKTRAETLIADLEITCALESGLRMSRDGDQYLIKLSAQADNLRILEINVKCDNVPYKHRVLFPYTPTLHEVSMYTGLVPPMVRLQLGANHLGSDGKVFIDARLSLTSIMNFPPESNNVGLPWRWPSNLWEILPSDLIDSYQTSPVLLYCLPKCEPSKSRTLELVPVPYWSRDIDGVSETKGIQFVKFTAYIQLCKNIKRYAFGVVLERRGQAPRWIAQNPSHPCDKTMQRIYSTIVVAAFPGDRLSPAFAIDQSGRLPHVRPTINARFTVQAHTALKSKLTPIDILKLYDSQTDFQSKPRSLSEGRRQKTEHVVSDMSRIPWVAKLEYPQKPGGRPLTAQVEVFPSSVSTAYGPVFTFNAKFKYVSAIAPSRRC